MTSFIFQLAIPRLASLLPMLVTCRCGHEFAVQRSATDARCPACRNVYTIALEPAQPRPVW